LLLDDAVRDKVAAEDRGAATKEEVIHTIKEE
jgi:hypothetical protein